MKFLVKPMISLKIFAGCNGKSTCGTQCVKCKLGSCLCPLK